MNDTIITEFEKLIKQIKYDIDHSTSRTEQTSNRFRLKNTQTVLQIIKDYPNKIKNGSEIAHLKGVGKGSIERIDEILKTGKLSEIRSQTKYKKYVTQMAELEQIFGIGTKKAYELVKYHKIKSVDDLKKAYKSKKIDLTQQIIVGLKYHGKYKKNILRSEMDLINILVHKNITKVDPNLKGEICGSYRRQKLTSNDVDILLYHPKIKSKRQLLEMPNLLIKFIKQLKKIGFILDDLTFDNYTTKYMGFCKLGDNPVRRIDVYYTPFESYPATLLHLTGSANFNQKTRALAIELGYTLNEYGLYKVNQDTKTKINTTSEKDILEKLGLEYVPPDKR
jgi:DNA polymerase beta